ncbi:MAG: pseudouridine synthase [Caulobacteraceae bacterium]|nr:pseudouridine synthase [Caulobacteraceae bacterium]
MSDPPDLTPDDIAFVRSLILFEDREIIAFNKPPGLSSQGGRIKAHTLDDLLWAFARRGGARPRMIHRLDRDTSGVILTARTQPGASFLGKAMMAHRFAKTYGAIVTPGRPEKNSGTIDVALRREEIGRESYMRVAADDHPDAEVARTTYRTLAAVEGAALIEARPKTGRMHQIRVHLTSIGRPIAGDVRYGGALAVNGHAAPRLMLHARALRFPHPKLGEMVIEAPWPDDFASLAGALGLELPEQSETVER